MQADKLKQFIHTKPDLRGLLLVVLVSSWLAGITINAWLCLPLLALLPGGALALLLTGCCWHLPVVRIGGLALLCLCLGAWRYSAVAPGNDTHAIHAFIGPSALQVQGEVADDPRLESNSTLITVKVESVSLDKGQSQQMVDGQVQVQALGATFDDPYAPHYGDTLQLEGRLTNPPGYATPELQASMAFPRILIVRRGGNPFLLFLYQARTTLAGILLQALPQPFAALMIAIFLSLRTPALKPLLLSFNVTGTAHLIAPSGFKVTLLAGLIGGGIRWLVPRQSTRDYQLLPAERQQGEWKHWLHTLLLIFCIAIYTMLSGGGPAAIRAGLMGILLVLAPRLRRFYNVYTAMALSALLMSFFDPFVLWDTGFLLSFIGTLGILLFTPLFQHFFRFLERLPLGFHIAEIVSVTLAAQVATLPIFALSFNQISFVAALANLASVPLLGVLLALGALLCLSGLIALPLALLCGWLAWPLLWYITTVIAWCAQLPGAYLHVSNLSPLAAWTYYALLAWLALLLFARWQPASHQQHQRTPLLSRRAKLFVQCALALITLLSISVLAQTTPSASNLTISLLSSGSPGQGQALFLRTRDGQTALIDEGASSTTITQTLDTYLPFWQRSISLLILSDTSPNNLAGLQDVITRYQVQHVVDAGMLHPTLAYARWRNTLDTRNLLYTQVRQGALITLGQQAIFQVLWPPTHLHKSSNETRDNALILRLLAPNLRLLLLNSTALSDYALQMFSLNIAPTIMQAEVVQLTSEAGKAFPAALANVLTLAHPSLILLTTEPVKQRKSLVQAMPTTSPTLPGGSWEVLHGEQTGPLELQSSEHGWSVNSS